MTTNDEATLRRTAELTWVTTATGNRLHHIEQATASVTMWCFTSVQLSCRRSVAAAYIPGVFERLGMYRCDRCCDSLGWPRGKGSPKNDRRIRALLGLDSDGAS